MLKGEAAETAIKTVVADTIFAALNIIKLSAITATPACRIYPIGMPRNKEIRCSPIQPQFVAVVLTRAGSDDAHWLAVEGIRAKLAAIRESDEDVTSMLDFSTLESARVLKTEIQFKMP